MQGKRDEILIILDFIPKVIPAKLSEDLYPVLPQRIVPCLLRDPQHYTRCVINIYPRVARLTLPRRGELHD